MAEALPTGAPNPENTENQQENRGQRRRDAARQATAREHTTNPETRARATALQQTNTAEVGSGLLGQIARFPIDVVSGTGRVAWKVTKGTAKFGGRAVVGGVKYPAVAGGGVVLAGGALSIGIPYVLGKALWQHGSTTYKSRNFFDSTAKNFQLTWSKMRVGKKK